MSLVRPTLIVAAGAAGSRVLGLVRDILFAQVLGAGPVADAFLAAFRLPNLVRRLLSEGGLNAALVPTLARLPPDRAAAFAGELFAGLSLALLALVAVVELAAGFAMLVLAPGLAADEQVLALASLYARLAFPLVAGVTLASFVGAVLNRHGRFAAPALAALGTNGGLILALLALGRSDLPLSQQGAWLAAASSLAALVQLAALSPAFVGRRRLFVLQAPRGSAALRGLLRTACVTLLAGGAFQLLVLAGTQAASFLPSGVSWLYFAERVVQLPLGLVATVAGTVLLPELAARHAAGENAALVAAQNRALEIAAVVALPAAAALALLSDPIVSVLFERGAFGPEDVDGTAAALAGLSLGLPFAAAGKVLTQTLFARDDAGRALLALAAALAAAGVGALAAAPAFGIAGVSAAVAFGSLVHAGALAAALRRRGLWRPDRRLASRLGRAAAATAVMALALDGALAAVGSVGIPALAGLCLGGLALYASAAWLLGAVTRADLAAARKTG